jgi:hypothetical protein
MRKAKMPLDEQRPALAAGSQEWLVLSRIQHGRTGAYHEPGEIVELAHLTAAEIADLVAKQIIKEVREHGTDDGSD